MSEFEKPSEFVYDIDVEDLEQFRLLYSYLQRTPIFFFLKISALERERRTRRERKSSVTRKPDGLFNFSHLKQ